MTKPRNESSITLSDRVELRPNSLFCLSYWSDAAQRQLHIAIHVAQYISPASNSEIPSVLEQSYLDFFPYFSNQELRKNNICAGDVFAFDLRETNEPACAILYLGSFGLLPGSFPSKLAIKVVDHYILGNEQYVYENMWGMWNTPVLTKHYLQFNDLGMKFVAKSYRMSVTSAKRQEPPPFVKSLFTKVM